MKWKPAKKAAGNGLVLGVPKLLVATYTLHTWSDLTTTVAITHLTPYKIDKMVDLACIGLGPGRRGVRGVWYGPR